MARKRTRARLDHEIYEATGYDPSGRSHNPNGGRRWKGTEVQSLLFARPQWTPSTAKTWAQSHRFKSGKVHVTDDYVRLRQFAPRSGAAKRTITFGQGIKAVVEETR